MKVPASHRLTPLETKLLNALQKVLVEDVMLAIIRRRNILEAKERQRKAKT